jgi:hypothetical protein
MPSCEPCFTEPAGWWCTQLGGLLFALQALFLPSDSPTQLQSSSCILTPGRYLRNAGKVGWVAIHVKQGVDKEEDVVRMVQSSPCESTRRIARYLHVSQTSVWRTLHTEDMYSYHVQRVQHLGPGDFAQRLEFCKRLNGSRQLHRYILFTDEA